MKLPPLRPRQHGAHAWLGTWLGILLFVVCLSGTWALFKDELGYWQYRALRLPASTAPVDTLLPAAVQAYEAATGAVPDTLQITLPGPWQRHWQMGGRGPGARAVWFDPISRRIAPAPPGGTPPGGTAQWLADLHRHLHLPALPGRLTVGILGIGMLALLLGGLYLHPRRRGQWLAWRRQGPARLWLADAHKLMGLWLAPMLLLITATGIMAGLGGPLTPALAPQAFPEAPQAWMRELMGHEHRMTGPPAPSAGLPLPRVLPRLLDGAGGLQPRTLTLTRWGRDDATLSVGGLRSGLISTALFERDRWRLSDGALLARSSMSGRGFWFQAFIAVQPLHFAQYGPGWLKTLYLLAGLAGAALAATGMWLHMTRTGRARSLHARLALGACAGLLLAYGCALAWQAWAQDLNPAWQPAVFWCAWALGIVLATLARQAQAAARHLLAPAGLAYLLAGLGDLAASIRLGGHALQADAIAIDLALASLGLAGLAAARAAALTPRASSPLPRHRTP